MRSASISSQCETCDRLEMGMVHTLSEQTKCCGDCKNNITCSLISPSSRLRDTFELRNDGTIIARQNVYEMYTDFCQKHSFEHTNQAVLGKMLKLIFGDIRSRRLGKRGINQMYYCDFACKSGQIPVEFERDASPPTKQVSRSECSPNARAKGWPDKPHMFLFTKQTKWSVCVFFHVQEVRPRLEKEIENNTTRVDIMFRHRHQQHLVRRDRRLNLLPLLCAKLQRQSRPTAAASQPRARISYPRQLRIFGWSGLSWSRKPSLKQSLIQGLVCQAICSTVLVSIPISKKAQYKKRWS